MIKFKQTLVAIALGVALSGCGSEESPSVGGSSEFSELRDYWSSYYIGDPSLPFDRVLEDTTDSMTASAAKWAQSYQPNSNDGLWSDIPFEIDSVEGREVIGEQLYKTYQRLFTMARAYSLPQGDLYQDSELLAVIDESLRLLNAGFYREGAIEYGNWWFWQLGISRSVNDTLVLLYGDLEPDLIASYNEATTYFLPSATHLNEGEGSTRPVEESTGANRVHAAQVLMLRAMLSDDKAGFDDVSSALDVVLDVVEVGDGFYADGSFIQHTDIAYNGTYGNGLLESLGMLSGVISMAEWGVDSDYLTDLYPLFEKSFYPFLIDGRMMDMVSGRAVSRLTGQNHKVGHAVLSSMLFYVESAPEPINGELRRFLKTQIHEDEFLDFLTNPRFFRNHQLALEIVNDDSIELLGERRAHVQFPSMDRVVHHRADWSFGVAYHSSRIGNYECMGGENLKGWHTGDGVSYLYNNQLGHFTDYWALVDSKKLPGTTVTSDAYGECKGQLRGDGNRQDLIDWAGGVELNGFGAVGFNFSNVDNTLAAKKSWFMFDDVVISVGYGISNSAAYTTMENRKFDSSAKVKVNGSELLEGGEFHGALSRLELTVPEQENPITYVVPSAHDSSVTRSCTTGNYNEIGTSDSEVSGCFATATLSHGMDDFYVYHLYPNSPSHEVDASELNGDYQVIDNSDLVQSVVNEPQSVAAFNFWGESDSGIVHAYGPLSMMYQAVDAQTLEVSVSDPTREQDLIRFKLDVSYEIIADEQDRLTQDGDGAFSVDVSDLGGRSYKFILVRT